MRSPQVINTNFDKHLAFDGENVISDTTQLPISFTVGIMYVKITLMDLYDLTSTTVDMVPFNPNSDAGFWYIETSKLTLTNRHKYVGKISQSTGSDVDHRDIKIQEFTVDNDAFEDTLMRLPYEIVIGATSKFVWYANDSYLGTSTNGLYWAPAYQGGTGTIYATDPSKVTHRGAVVPSI